MTPLVIYVWGRPVAKQRPRTVSKGGRTWTYTPSKTGDYESLVKVSALEEMKDREAFSGPVEVTISLLFKKPKHGKHEYPHRPDWDNGAKAVCDALNGICWEDDSQIVKATVEKMYSLCREYVRIEIQEYTILPEPRMG